MLFLLFIIIIFRMYRVLKLQQRWNVVLTVVALLKEKHPKVKIHSWNLLFIVLEKHVQKTLDEIDWVKQIETCQDCTLSVLLFSEVVKLKGLWLCVCWKHKGRMCVLYPWWIPLDDSRLSDSGLCKRTTQCCSPAASLACDDSPYWFKCPTLFSVSP